MTEDFSGFEKVCEISKLVEGRGEHFKIRDIDIALFKVNNKVYALNNICPHQHANIIHDGFIEDGYVICPAHGWGFNLKDGKMREYNSKLASYKVKLHNGYVYVKVYGKKFNWNF